MTLRLAIDHAKRKKLKLYLIFIDFRTAYDTVPRKKLMEVLKANGCGKTMLRIITALYRSTKAILRSTVILTSVGIKQGAPTSCYLFVIYINEMVRRIRHAFAADGFLGVLHVLLLMDDTVLLATTRHQALAKLEVLVAWCGDYGMHINLKKTMFMVVNGEVGDKEPLIAGDVIVKYTTKYLYLGAWVTDSGKWCDVIQLHEEHCNEVVNKFAIFCSANTNMPFFIKKKYKHLFFQTQPAQEIRIIKNSDDSQGLRLVSVFLTVKIE